MRRLLQFRQGLMIYYVLSGKPKCRNLSFSQLQADYALNLARKNMLSILDELEERAPKAKIYVIGYYFAYPTVHPTQKKEPMPS